MSFRRQSENRESVMATLRERFVRLAREDRGAIMIMGTFMGIALIGATWYVIGLGDAFIYRERVQEAADSASFSAAAVHAKGMNFIAAINIIMLVLTALWLVINIIEDILGAILDIVGSTPGKLGPGSCFLDGNEVIPSIAGTSVNGRRSCCTPATTLNLIVDGGTVASGGGAATAFCDISEAVQPVHNAVKDAREKYAGVLETVLPALGKVETVVKNVTPVAGFAASFIAAHEYNEVGLSISASEIPAGGAGGVGGLPLHQKNFDDLCKHAIDGVFDWIKEHVIGNIPLVGSAINTTPFQQIIDVIQNIITGSLVSRYCSFTRGTEVWEQEGFYTVHDVAKNGHDLMQIWTFVPSTQNDTQGHIVPIGSRGAAAAPTPSTQNTYYAQAEFYYDCGDTWESSDCNENDNAMFGLRWKARLRRVKVPSIGSDIAGEINAAISNALESAADQIAPTDPEYGPGGAGHTTVGQVANNESVKFVFGLAGDAASGPINSVGAALDPAGFHPTVVH